MRWFHYASYSFGGAFLANAVPHYVNGVMGHPFQSPFAHPPGEGLSSALVNVLWGFGNVVIGYVLVAKVGTFDLRRWRHFIVAGAGALVMSVMLARAFGRFYGGGDGSEGRRTLLAVWMKRTSYASSGAR